MNILPRALTNQVKSTSIFLKRTFAFSSFTRANNIYNIQDEDDFKNRVLQNSKPVIVDFHAVWCGPCKILGPRLEKLMATYDGKADFAKVDIDQLSDLAFEFNVNSVPTVVAIKNGKQVDKFVGLIDDDKIKSFVKKAIEQ